MDSNDLEVLMLVLMVPMFFVAIAANIFIVLTVKRMYQQAPEAFIEDFDAPYHFLDTFGIKFQLRLTKVIWSSKRLRAYPEEV